MKIEEGADANNALKKWPGHSFLGPNTSTTAAHRVIGVPLLAVKTHKRKRARTRRKSEIRFTA